MTHGVVIADDLTGAADTGVMFAKRGLRTLVLWNLDTIPDADVWVYSTESRHLPQEQAYQRTLQAAQQFVERGVDWIYKKVDSTLRGNPGTELNAVLDALDEKRALVAPAFPPQGRTTSNGMQYVNGVPLSQTEFGEDVPTSQLAEIFAEAQPSSQLTLDTLRNERFLHSWIVNHPQHVILADAETNADLASLVQAGQQASIRCWCGSAGLAQALGSMFIDHLAASTQAGPMLDTSTGWFGNGVLVIAASQHPATKAQLDHLQTQGIPAILPEQLWFTEALPIDIVTDQILYHLKSNDSAFLTTTHLPSMPGMNATLVQRLAQATHAVLEQQTLSGLILTGGDTAAAVVTALGAQGLELRGEVESGVPWGVLTGGLAHGIPVVTKAGGFGNEETLSQAVEFLGMLIV